MSERRAGHSKLVAKEGKIVSESTVSIAGPEPIIVLYKRAAIWPDASFGEIQIQQGDKSVRLTFPQSESLAKQLLHLIS